MSAQRQAALLEEIVEDEGQTVLGWRDVPHDAEAIGWLAQESLPHMRQVVIGAQGPQASDNAMRSSASST